MTSLRFQWTWIRELYHALEEHLLNAHAYRQVRFAHEMLLTCVQAYTSLHIW